MKKILDFYYDHQLLITFVSLVLMVVSMTIIACVDADPLWYILGAVLGLPVLLLFIYVFVVFLIITPIKKIVNRKKDK